MNAPENEVGSHPEEQRQLLAEVLSESFAFGQLHPLSFGQEGMWYLEQLEPGSSIHNLTSGLRIYGRLHLDSLRRALRAVTGRHEALRTTFLEAGGEVLQRVLASFAPDIAVVDLRELPKPGREPEAYRLAVIEQRRPFDLRAGPLFRMAILRIEDGEWILLFTLHHLVSDGWSMTLFAQELSSLYTAYMRSQVCQLPAVPVQYGAYARWQRGRFQSGELRGSLSYWKARLEGSLALLDLASDRGRSEGRASGTASCSMRIPVELQSRITEIAGQEGVTTFTVLLAGLFLLLHRYTQQEDICIGVPVAGREFMEVESLIGLFANTVVIRNNLAGNPAFRDLIGQTQSNLIEAYSHQEVPFEAVVAELQPERSLSHNPIFQVMMTMSRAPREQQRFGALEAVPYPLAALASGLDFTATVHEAADGSMWCRFEYSSALFDGARMTCMLEHFCLLLSRAAADPGRRIGDLDCLSPEEHRQIRIFNGTAAEYPNVCVHELVARQVRETPDRVALRYEGQQLSYAELQDKVERIAAALAHAGAGPGQRVAICLERSSALVMAVLAIGRTGAAYVPFDPEDPPARIRAMLEDAQVCLLLTTPDLASKLQADVSCVWIEDALEAAPGAPGATLPSLADPAYVIYTSGSTGVPKGVCVSHGSLVNLLHSMRFEPGFGAEDRLLAVTSLSFDIATLELLLPLTCGGQVVVASQRELADAQRLLDLIRSAGITVLQATPSRWRLLLEAGWTRGDGLLRVWCGGEALSEDLARELLGRSEAVWNLYGPTETTIWSSVSRVRKAETVTLGRPIRNTRLHVLDRRLGPVPRGARGELYIGGDGVAEGYWRRPELSAEKFVWLPVPLGSGEPKARFFRTGDEVLHRLDGELEYVGRLDSQVKVRGRRMELGEIERALAGVPGVQQAVALVREDRPGDQRLTAYVVRRAGFTISGPDIQASLRDHLPGYMIPAIALVDEIPLTTSGKADWKRLPSCSTPEWTLAGSGAASGQEERLLRIWQKVLGVDQILPGDNFFDLGGYSLLALKLLAEVEKVTGKRLAVESFLKAQTVREMARVLEAESEDTPSLLVKMKPGKQLPPLFLIPGASGDVLGYAELPRLLSPEQPVYGLQSAGLDGKSKPLECIEEIAQTFVEEILAKQTGGPYQLAGFCIGGMVAYEIAQRLVSRGEEVALLALVEAWPPAAVPVYSEEPFRRKLLRRAAKAPGHLRTAAQLPPGAAIHYLSRRLANFRNSIDPRKTTEAERLERGREQVLLANHRAAARYVPAPYPGRITLLIPRDGGTGADGEDPRLFWAGLAQRGAEVIYVNGNRGNLLERRQAEDLAQALSEHLLEESLAAQ